MQTYTFAPVCYANAVPLAHFLTRVQPGIRVVPRRPSALVEELLARRVDAALVPVADYFAHPELAMVEGLGICADGNVRSVLLMCRRPIREVRTLARDPNSRSSNALAQIVLERHFRLSLRTIERSIDEAADASVIIGDEALKAAAAPCGNHDLAGLWKEMTGLPFVFAVWAYRADHPEPEALSRIARASLEMGLERLPELAGICMAQTGLSCAQSLDYLRSSIHYMVGNREVEAMELFRGFWNDLSVESPSNASTPLGQE